MPPVGEPCGCLDCTYPYDPDDVLELDDEDVDSGPPVVTLQTVGDVL